MQTNMPVQVVCSQACKKHHIERPMHKKIQSRRSEPTIWTTQGILQTIHIRFKDLACIVKCHTASLFLTTTCIILQWLHFVMNSIFRPLSCYNGIFTARAWKWNKNIIKYCSYTQLYCTHLKVWQLDSVRFHCHLKWPERFSIFQHWWLCYYWTIVSVFLRINRCLV